MGRKKSAESTVVTDRNQIDAVFASLNQEAKSEWGHKLFIRGEEESRLICLELPFALQILLQSLGLPLGRFMIIVGPPESCKSAFGYELCRMFRRAGGGFDLIETENKDSVSLRKSITGYDSKLCSAIYCELVEEWQSALKNRIDLAIQLLEAIKPARSIPWCYLIDSLAGNTSEKVADGIDKEGHAGLTHPVVANMISTFMKRMPHWLGRYPMSVIGVNHLKLAPDQYGNMSKRNIQGGYAPRFAETSEFDLRVLGKQIDRKEGRHEKVKTVEMTIAKNSAAQRGVTIDVEMCWWFEPVEKGNPDSPFIQRTIWDWGKASINYLLGDLPGGVQVKRKVHEILDLHENSKAGTIWSDALGIPQTSPVSYRRAGMMLEARRDIRDALAPLLGIATVPLFKTGVDIDSQRDAIKARLIHLEGDGLVDRDGVIEVPSPSAETPAQPDFPDEVYSNDGAG